MGKNREKLDKATLAAMATVNERLSCAWTALIGKGSDGEPTGSAAYDGNPCGALRKGPSSRFCAAHKAANWARVQADRAERTADNTRQRATWSVALVAAIDASAIARDTEPGSGVAMASMAIVFTGPANLGTFAGMVRDSGFADLGDKPRGPVTVDLTADGPVDVVQAKAAFAAFVESLAQNVGSDVGPFVESARLV